MSHRLIPALLLLLLPAIAAAEPALHATGTPTGSRNVFAAKIIGGASFGPQEEAHRRAGAAMLYQRALVPAWLEGEISVGALVSGQSIFTPVELLLKVPFRVTSHWDLFAGAGPAMMVDFGHRQARFGGVASVGTFYWLSEHVGLLFEVDYLVLHDNGATHEIEGAFGVAWRLM